MKLDQLQEKLLEVARRNPPSDHVPPGFEHRVMARIRAWAESDRTPLWIAFWWRLAMGALAVSLLLMVLSGDLLGSQPSQLPLEEHLEVAVFAPIDESTSSW